MYNAEVMRRLFLDVNVPLVQAVAERLLAYARKTELGVVSLEHVLVVVPTRQAGRRLRQMLAERTGACIPPEVLLPSALVDSRQSKQVLTPAESLGVLAQMLSASAPDEFPALFPEEQHGEGRGITFGVALEFSRQLHDLWRLLGECSLLMADVAARIDKLLPDTFTAADEEVARWQDLAKIEQRFFARAAELGRVAVPAAERAGWAAAEPPAGIERVVLPALLDAPACFFGVVERWAQQGLPVEIWTQAPADEAGRFDAWGRPLPEQWIESAAPLLPIGEEQIILHEDPLGLAEGVADQFAAVAPDDELPGLGMADDALFSELQAAFALRDLPLHDPADQRLEKSALGRVMQQVAAFEDGKEPDYPQVSAFLREADVQRWLGQTAAIDLGAVLSGLDEAQNQVLPRTLADVRKFAEHEAANATHERQKFEQGEVVKALDALCAWLELSTALEKLRALFMPRVLDLSLPRDRDLAVAVQTAYAQFEALESELLGRGFTDAQRMQMLSVLLAEASYQLESADPDAIAAEGWLEIQWSPKTEIWFAGFHEGAIPAAPSRHVFLPDSVRKQLGLMCNERRLARDTCLLLALLRSRPAEAVRFYLERADAQGNVLKPSRLLFLCDGAVLPVRVLRLFSDAEFSRKVYPSSLPDSWRLRLPEPSAPPAKLSVTMLKAYLTCPFTFYLQTILDMGRQSDRAEELDVLAFGTLIHGVLNEFAESDVAASADAGAIETWLNARCDELFAARYGGELSAILRLQLMSLRRHLSCFAVEQAKLAADGWRIHQHEVKFARMLNGINITGVLDRVDYNARLGVYRIMDYKTWKSANPEALVRRIVTDNAASVLEAREAGRPVLEFGGEVCVWIDLQLPLYHWLAAGGGLFDDGKVECGYFVLGGVAEDTKFIGWEFTREQLDTAVETAQWICRRVNHGVYWPIQALGEEFAALFPPVPEDGIAPEWINGQLCRLAEVQGG